MGERIRAAVEDYRMEVMGKDGEKKEEKLTVSVGVASIGEGVYPEPMNRIYTDKELIDRFFTEHVTDEDKIRDYAEIKLLLDDCGGVDVNPDDIAVVALPREFNKLCVANVLYCPEYQSGCSS